MRRGLITLLTTIALACLRSAHAAGAADLSAHGNNGGPASPGGSAGVRIGNAVSLRGDVLLAGVPKGASTAIPTGMVAVFRRVGSSWNLETMLQPSMPEPYFGWAVAIGDGTLLVASPASSNQGVLRTFALRAGLWSETDPLPARGFVLSAAGNEIATDVGNFSEIGLYQRREDGWLEDGTIMSYANYIDGLSVAGDRVAIAYAEGAIKVDPVLYRSLQINARTDAGWTREYATMLPRISTDDVAIAGDFAIVVQSTASGVGSAIPYAFADGEWAPDGALDIGPACQGPVSVSLWGSLAAIGCPNDTVATATHAGRVRIFERVEGIWTPIAELVDAAGTAGALFGSDLSLDGTTLAIGAPGTPGDTTTIGKVVVFEASGGVWSQTATLTPDLETVFASGFDAVL
jgi:FG-GAP repeat protein